MVRKETCPMCRRNKVITVESRAGAGNWRPCHGCNGAGYRVRMTPGGGLPARH